MAGDWIKMRIDLRDDPAVIQMSKELKASKDLIVGILHRLWSWADQQTCDGNLPGLTMVDVERHMRVKGLTEALASVGWLEPVTTPYSGIRFPHFTRHMGSSAKKRAFGRLRSENRRNAASVTRALPEKRREEKSKKKPPKPPLKGGLESSLSQKGKEKKKTESPEASELHTAVVALFYPSGVLPRQQRRVMALVNDLATLSATPVEVRRRKKRWASVYKTPCTLRSLVARWDLVEAPPPMEGMWDQYGDEP